MQGAYWPGIDRITTMLDGYGEVLPLGGGSSLSRLAEYGLPAEGREVSTTETMVSQISGLGQSSISYNFEGLIGPIGPIGRPGPPGVGITSYTGGYIPVDDSALTSDVPFTTGITFSDNGAGRVTWTTGTLRYKGTDYVISPQPVGNTHKYIYWDLNSLNTQFITTDTLADVLGADKWAMCYNDGGTPYPSSAHKILHGGYIEASTIDTVHLNAAAVTTDKIQANAITTSKILAGNIVAASIQAKAIQTDKINELSVTTPKINNYATTRSASDTDHNVSMTSFGNPLFAMGSVIFHHEGGIAHGIIWNLDINGVKFDYGGAASGITQDINPVSLMGVTTSGSGPVTATIEFVGTNWSITSASIYMQEHLGK